MLLNNPLNSVFDQATKVKVLRRLFVTRQEMTIRQIAALVGVSHVQAGKSLASLEKTGVVISKRVGRAIIFKANLEHITSKQLLVPLFEAEGKLRDQLTTDLAAELKSSVKGVYIYGSFASGTEGPESDLDLLVVTEKTKPKLETQLDRLSERIRSRYGMELNYIVMPFTDLIRRFKAGDGLIAGIVEKSLPVVGTQLSEILANA